MSPDTTLFLDSDPEFVPERPGSEIVGTRYYRHVRHPTPEGLAEVCCSIDALFIVYFSIICHI